MYQCCSLNDWANTLPSVNWNVISAPSGAEWTRFVSVPAFATPEKAHTESAHAASRRLSIRRLPLLAGRPPGGCNTFSVEAHWPKSPRDPANLYPELAPRQTPYQAASEQISLRSSEPTVLASSNRRC